MCSQGRNGLIVGQQQPFFPQLSSHPGLNTAELHFPRLPTVISSLDTDAMKLLPSNAKAAKSKQGFQLQNEQCNQKEKSNSYMTTFTAVRTLFKRSLDLTLANSNATDAQKEALLERKTCDKRLYKTELCRQFLSNNRQCSYGTKCQYAHGTEELRLPFRHPQYKSIKCEQYQSTGFCSYGDRCDFIHDETQEELAAIHFQVQLYHEYRRRKPECTEVPITEILSEDFVKSNASIIDSGSESDVPPSKSSAPLPQKLSPTIDSSGQ